MIFLLWYIVNILTQRVNHNMSQMQLPVVLQLSKTICFRTTARRFFASSQHLKSNQYEEMYNNKRLKFQCKHYCSDKKILYNSTSHYTWSFIRANKHSFSSYTPEQHNRLHFVSISTSSECGRQPSIDRQATTTVAP